MEQQQTVVSPYTVGWTIGDITECTSVDIRMLEKSSGYFGD